MPPTVVNILGLQRSGTSMLSAMLAHGAEAVAVGEIAGWYRLAQYRDDATPPPRYAFASEVPRNEFHRAAMEHLDVAMIIDSSKSLEWALAVNRWHRNTDVRVFNILIWKHPVDHTYSLWKRGLRDSLSPRFYKWPFYHRRLLRSGAEFVSLRYDTLIEQPEQTLGALCGLIGITYFPGKEQFWDSEESLIGSSPGVKRQAARGTSKLQLESKPPAFHPIADRVRCKINSSDALRRVLQELAARDIVTHPENINSSGHAYTPSTHAQLEQLLTRLAKDSLLRFRFNFLQSIFGHNVGRLYQKYFTPRIEKRTGSFDPEN